MTEKWQGEVVTWNWETSLSQSLNENRSFITAVGASFLLATSQVSHSNQCDFGPLQNVCRSAFTQRFGVQMNFCTLNIVSGSMIIAVRCSTGFITSCCADVSLLTCNTGLLRVLRLSRR
jgi:hypothetical protein